MFWGGGCTFCIFLLIDAHIIAHMFIYVFSIQFFTTGATINILNLETVMAVVIWAYYSWGLWTCTKPDVKALFTSNLDNKPLFSPPSVADLKKIRGCIPEDGKHCMTGPPVTAFRAQSDSWIFNLWPFAGDSVGCTSPRSGNIAKSFLLKLHCSHHQGYRELLMDKWGMWYK